MTEQLLRIVSFLMTGLLCVLSATAQERKVTPVETDEEAPEKPILHYYDKHGEALDEPVYILADLDTVVNTGPRPVAPLFNGVSIGANFADAILQFTGQGCQSYDIWADVSLYNWFFPVVELGIGMADNRPEEGNFRYRARPSFYGKIGFNYNFLYKSSPDYQVFLGLRAAYSRFSYDVTDITVNSSYWDQSNHFSLPRQHASCFYGEALAGLKVKLWRQLSMGWTIRWKFKMHTVQGAESSPWFVPGYGTGPLGFTFSLIYTIPPRGKASGQ